MAELLNAKRYPRSRLRTRSNGYRDELSRNGPCGARIRQVGFPAASVQLKCPRFNRSPMVVGTCWQEAHGARSLADSCSALISKVEEVRPRGLSSKPKVILGMAVKGGWETNSIGSVGVETRPETMLPGICLYSEAIAESFEQAR